MTPIDKAILIFAICAVIVSGIYWAVKKIKQKG